MREDREKGNNKGKKRKGTAGGSGNVCRARTVIGTVRFEGGREEVLRACVDGVVLDLNWGVDEEAIRRDSMGDGWIAIIRPKGEFPPVAKEPKARDDTVEPDDNKKTKVM